MARITDINSLLFPVELRPVYTEHKVNGNIKRFKLPNSKAVVNKQTGKPISVVSNTYRLITNEEAIDLGKKCASQVFESEETKNIEIFNVYAPSTASYCHIDLIHSNFYMNIFDDKDKSDIYLPYIRVTNSYNTSRALKFDIGLCRKLCLNGVIFESETVKFKFSHVKKQLTKDIEFILEDNKIKKLFEEFVSHTKRLKSFKINKGYSINIIKDLFNIRNKSEINFKGKDQNVKQYNALINEIHNRLNKYVQESGKNAYSLFNTITDLASHPIENRYFRRDMNSMQRLAGNWMKSFQKEIQQNNFKISNYVKLLNNTPKEALQRGSS